MLVLRVLLEASFTPKEPLGFENETCNNFARFHGQCLLYKSLPNQKTHSMLSID